MRHGQRMSDPQQVGFVVIGRNEGERLKRCLESIPQAFRVVYVDSGSTDGSGAFARSRGAITVDLDMSRPFTAARSRNEGADVLLACAPDIAFIQFVDGDCEIERGWIETARDFLHADQQVAVVCGRRRERFPGASPYNRMADQEWDTPVGQAAACGGDALYRRVAFQEVGGFDAAMIAGEEPELCGRLRASGWQVWRLDAPMTIHDAAMTRFGQWWTRAVRGGFGYAQVWASSGTLYGRELARAMAWTVGVTLAAIALAFLMGPVFLLAAPLIWFAQWSRLALRDGRHKATFLLIGKFAEATGAFRFWLGRLRGRRSGAIFYK